MEAVKVCSLGQVTNALFEVGGPDERYMRSECTRVILENYSMSIQNILSNSHMCIIRCLLSILVVNLLADTIDAQSTYWRTLGDSLIHSRESLSNLSKKVDSLHRVFEKRVPTQKQMFSAQQGYGHYFQVIDAPFSLDSLKRDLMAGLSKNELAQKYPEIKWVRDSVLIYKYETVNRKGMPEQVFVEAPNELENGYLRENSISPELVAPTFVFDSYNGDSGGGFLFYQKLSSQPIPLEVEKLMHYVDFMIGEWPRNRFGGRDPNIKYGSVLAARDTIQTFMTRMAAIPKENIDSVVARRYLENPDFRAEVEAVAQATLLVVQSANFQDVNSIILPLLPLNRQYDLLCRQPLDWSCGNNPAPRYHILKTAQVAAQIGDLSVVLNVHFSVTNDGFGSSEYYPNRRSYFRELEAIGLDGVMIAIGACFTTIEARPKCNIEYFGRSIRETGKPEALEAAILKFVADTELDDLNRLRMIWLYRIWAGISPDKQAKMDKLRSLEPSLPSYLRKAVQ